MEKENKKRIKRSSLILFAVVVIILSIVFVYINLPVGKVADPVRLGVTFSSRYAQDIGLDWKQAYIAALDDLKIKNIRIPIYWDQVALQKGEYDFSDIDWQMAQAQKRGARVTLVVGQKVPRWPECFIPQWASHDDNLRKQQLLIFIDETVERYKTNAALARWQVENEPFLNFGVCPAFDVGLLDQEIGLVRSLDNTHPVVVTDSGELSLWVSAAKRADIFGTTMYRTVYSAKHGFIRYPIGPNFFKLKKMIVKIFAGQANTIVIELQGEPWIDGWTVSQPLEKQLQSMNAGILRDNVQFAKNTGIAEIYIWGVEWWYWLAKEKNDPSVWKEAEKLFQENQI